MELSKIIFKKNTCAFTFFIEEYIEDKFKRIVFEDNSFDKTMKFYNKVTRVAYLEATTAWDKKHYQIVVNTRVTRGRTLQLNKETGLRELWLAFKNKK